jgi:hypothetical protein
MSGAQPGARNAVTFATASYGSGASRRRHSSPADDGTGDSGDSLYGGWDKATGGKNRESISTRAWLLNPAPT